MNVWLVEYVPSPASIVTVYVPALPSTTLPEMSPVVLLTLSPVGNPTAPNTSVPLLESLEVIDSDTEPPSVYVSSAIVSTLTGLLTVQVKVSIALAEPFVATTVTEYGP